MFAALVCAVVLLTPPIAFALVGSAWAGTSGADEVLEAIGAVKSGIVPNHPQGGGQLTSSGAGFQGETGAMQAPVAEGSGAEEPTHILLAQLSAQEIPTEIRLWPRQQPIRLGYRINGSYRVLRQRLREVSYKGFGHVKWEREFESIADVDVEALFLERVKSFSELSSFDIAAERFNAWDRWADFDMCFDLYLSDRTKDLRSFPCLQGLERRLGSVTERHDAFTTMGWAGSYGIDKSIKGAACLATYSAYTFRQEIGRDFDYELQGRSRSNGMRQLPVFVDFVGHTIGGTIMADSRGLFGRLRENTGRALEKDRTPSCQRAVQETYRAQLERIFDNCFSIMLGLPMSDVSPSSVVSRPDAPVLMNLRGLPLLEVGSSDWVQLVSLEASRDYHDLPRFRILEQHRENLVRDLYSKTGSGEGLRRFGRPEIEAMVKNAIEEKNAPARAGLYTLVEDDCLGKK